MESWVAILRNIHVGFSKINFNEFMPSIVWTDSSWQTSEWDFYLFSTQKNWDWASESILQHWCPCKFHNIMSLAENPFDITVHCFIELFREGEGERHPNCFVSGIALPNAHSRPNIHRLLAIGTTLFHHAFHSAWTNLEGVFLFCKISVCFETHKFFWVFFLIELFVDDTPRCV